MPFPGWVACGHTGTEISQFGPSDMDEKWWLGAFWKYHGQYDLSEGGERKVVQKQSPLQYLICRQGFFEGRWCLSGRQISNL